MTDWFTIVQQEILTEGNSSEMLLENQWKSTRLVKSDDTVTRNGTQHNCSVVCCMHCGMPIIIIIIWLGWSDI